MMFSFSSPLRAEDMVYAFVEATAGDFAPVLVLRDFGDKPLSTGNLDGVETSASLFHQFEIDSQNNTLASFWHAQWRIRRDRRVSPAAGRQ